MNKEATFYMVLTVMLFYVNHYIFFQVLMNKTYCIQYKHIYGELHLFNCLQPLAKDYITNYIHPANTWF